MSSHVVLFPTIHSVINSITKEASSKFYMPSLFYCIESGRYTFRLRHNLWICVYEGWIMYTNGVFFHASSHGYRHIYNISQHDMGTIMEAIIYQYGETNENSE